MLDPFVTGPRHTGRSKALLLSVAAHGLLIYAAFAPRAGTIRSAAGDVASEHPPAMERIRFIEVAPPREAAKPTARVKPRAVASLAVARLNAPELGPISIPGPPMVADIDLSSKINAPDSTAKSVAPLTELIKQVVDKPATEVGRVGPYSKEEVEKVVAPFPRNPKPVYPERMERQGVETSFIAQFVVDSTGLVDRESILFPTNVHALFIESVREALRRARFYPAEVGGHRVRQLVEQQFSFVIVDSRGARR